MPNINYTERLLVSRHQGAMPLIITSAHGGDQQPPGAFVARGTIHEITRTGHEQDENSVATEFGIFGAGMSRSVIQSGVAQRLPPHSKMRPDRGVSN